VVQKMTGLEESESDGPDQLRRTSREYIKKKGLLTQDERNKNGGKRREKEDLCERKVISLD